MSATESFSDLYFSDADHPATWVQPYLLHGQGVLIFNILRKSSFEIVIRSEKSKNNTEWISLEIQEKKARFKLGGRVVQVLAEKYEEGVGFNPVEVTSYWFSFNRDTLVLKYGKGYFMEETTLLSFDFLAGLTIEEQVKKRDKMEYLFGAHIKKLAELYDVLPCNILTNIYALQMIEGKSMQSYIETSTAEQDVLPNLSSNALQLLKSRQGEHYINIARDIISVENKVDHCPYPLVVNWPFAVLDSSNLSLFKLDKNDYIFSASLPAECLELYSNVLATNVDLDWTPNHRKYKFSDALRYNLETEGKMLYNKLKEKNLKYLRITLGSSHGNSPGIPYVLELWSKNNGSPVHSHGNSFGVIKVLFGGIRIEVYNKDMKTKIKEFNVQKGDITWMSPYWYQTHRLFNDTNDFCATIQCYKYGREDKVRWPSFSYVKEGDCIAEFLPNSDFTFTEVNRIVLDEYTEHMSKNP